MVTKRKSREPGEMTEAQAFSAAAISLCSGFPIVEPICNYTYIQLNDRGQESWRETVHFAWPGKSICIILIPDLGSCKIGKRQKHCGNLTFARTLRRMQSYGWIVFPFTYQEVRYTLTFERFWLSIQIAYNIVEEDADLARHGVVGQKLSTAIFWTPGPKIDPADPDLCGQVRDPAGTPRVDKGTSS